MVLAISDMTIWWQDWMELSRSRGRRSCLQGPVSDITSGTGWVRDRKEQKTVWSLESLGPSQSKLKVVGSQKDPPGTPGGSALLPSATSWFFPAVKRSPELWKGVSQARWLVGGGAQSVCSLLSTPYILLF